MHLGTVVILHIIGNVLAIGMLAFLGLIFVGVVAELVMPKWDCSKNGHTDVYYGCTVCRTSYAHKDKYNRPCCWFRDYAWQCGVCHMKTPKPEVKSG